MKYNVLVIGGVGFIGSYIVDEIVSKGLSDQMNYPKVSIIILNWNGKDDTIECLESIKGIDYSNYKVIVVDNGSSDGSQKILRERFSYVTLIENKTNLGFAEGNNIGMRHVLKSGSDYILLLNNDTVVDKKLLKELIIVAESDQKIGIVGPKIYYYNDPNRIWFSGGLISLKKGMPCHIGVGEIDRGQYDEIREVDYITGCAMLVRRDVIEEIGMFDLSYFAYFEDADLNMQAHKAGFKIVFAPKGKVWHKVSASTGGEQSPFWTYLNTRNRLLFIRNNFGLGDQILSTLYNIYFISRTLVGLLFRRRVKQFRSVILGVYDFLIGRFEYRQI